MWGGKVTKKHYSTNLYMESVMETLETVSKMTKEVL